MAHRRTRHWKHRGVIILYRMIRWSQRRLLPGVRSIIGLLLMMGGVFGFLPVLGFWMFPLGVAVAVTDIPPLRRRTERWLAKTRRRYHMDLLNHHGEGK